MKSNVDRETLRALADEGNEKALDRLADLADARDDVDELSDLLDEGSEYAGDLLTRRAVAAQDLRELQRLSDAGCEDAGFELDRLLSEPLSSRPVPSEVVRQYFRRLFVERDLSVCEELLAPEYIDHDAPAGTPAGPAATRAYAAQMFEDMPDLTVDLHEVHADAGAVMLRASWRGTRRDGARFQQTGLALVHVSDTGQLLERWSAYQPIGPAEP